MLARNESVDFLVCEYLARGGKITKCPTVSADSVLNTWDISLFEDPKKNNSIRLGNAPTHDDEVEFYLHGMRSWGEEARWDED